MGDVHALPGHPIEIPEGDADPKIVAVLEDLLEKARSGRIRAVAWATYKRGDTISHGWSPGAFGFHLGGAIAVLANRYCAEYPGE